MPSSCPRAGSAPTPRSWERRGWRSPATWPPARAVPRQPAHRAPPGSTLGTPLLLPLVLLSGVPLGLRAVVDVALRFVDHGATVHLHDALSAAHPRVGLT